MQIYNNVIIVSSENTKKIDMNLVYEKQHLSKYEQLKTRHYNIMPNLTYVLKNL